MQSVKTEKDLELLGLIYKNVKMGSESIINLMPKVADDKLKSDMTEKMNSYETYARKAEDLLLENGKRPKEENLVTKLSSKAGIAMNTMIDSTTSHIAQMMIEGSTMNVTDLTKNIHKYDCEGAENDVLSFARDIVNFEEKNIENMNQYL